MYLMYWDYSCAIPIFIHKTSMSSFSWFLCFIEEIDTSVYKNNLENVRFYFHNQVPNILCTPCWWDASLIRVNFSYIPRSIILIICLKSSNDKHKRCIAPGEARTHGLQIMRLTRCLLRYRGCMWMNMVLLISSRFFHREKPKNEIASAGNRTRVNCLEGSYAHHYTTDARLSVGLI